MILSLNGENFFIKASKDSITVTTNSVRSGLRALLSLDEHHRIIENSNRLNTALKGFGWTLYAHIGTFKFAVLGSKGRRGILKALFFFGRIGKTLGAV
jgi:hypothetical protein